MEFPVFAFVAVSKIESVQVFSVSFMEAGLKATSYFIDCKESERRKILFSVRVFNIVFCLIKALTFDTELKS